MNKGSLLLIFYGFLLLQTATLSGQTTSQTEGIAAYVTLDSLVVTAQKQGFDVADFIRMVREDRSYYQAFQQLRLVPFRAKHSMTFQDKKGRISATYTSLTQQEVSEGCRQMNVIQESTSGDFYRKNGGLRYYTAKLYDRVFFTHGKVCGLEETPAPSAMIEDTDEARGLEKYYQELKKLIFQPGEAIQVPLIGGKTAIFSEKLAPYYDYAIRSLPYQDGTDCYVFTVAIKPAYESKKEGKTIIKSMETYFAKANFQVMGRRYSLDYSGPVFSFSIEMAVDLAYAQGRYLPKKVAYTGKWNVITKKQETGQFSMELY